MSFRKGPWAAIKDEKAPTDHWSLSVGAISSLSIRRAPSPFFNFRLKNKFYFTPHMFRLKNIIAAASNITSLSLYIKINRHQSLPSANFSLPKSLLISTATRGTTLRPRTTAQSPVRSKTVSKIPRKKGMKTTAA